MRSFANFAGLICAVLFSGKAFAADPADSTCRDAVLGRICTRTAQANPPSIYGQYGYVEIRALPPSDINAAIKKTLRKQPLDVVKRLFQDRTVAGLVTLKIVLVDGDKETTIGMLPISTFSTSDKGGITVTDTSLRTGGQSYFRATPYFKLDQRRYSVKAFIAVHTTTNTNSNIAKFVSGALKVTTPFLGAPGAVVSTLSQDDVVKRISDFENRIFDENRSLDPNELVQLAFTADNAAEYSYEFDPKAVVRSGFVGVRLRAIPSLFTNDTDQSGKQNFHVKDIGITVAAETMLGYAYSSTQTMREALKIAAGQAYWDEFHKPFSSEAVFTPPCLTVRDATTSTVLGLTAVDAKALFWATYVTSSNTNSAAARATTCLIADATPKGGDGFKRYGLDLPDLHDLPQTIQPTLPTLTSGAGGGGGLGPKPEDTAVVSGPALSKADYRKFVDLVAFDLRQPQGLGDGATTKKALLGSIFADKVGFVTPMDFDPFLQLDPSPVDQAKIVDVFAALPLKSGCFYRLADQKTRFFARAIGPDGQPSEVLWHLAATTKTDGVVSHTFITDLEVRPAKSTDFAVASDILANRPACLDPKRSPE